MADIVLATVYFTNLNDVLAINEIERERTRTPNHRALPFRLPVKLAVRRSKLPRSQSSIRHHHASVVRGIKPGAGEQLATCRVTLISAEMERGEQSSRGV
jgi:hypothetical protein